MQLMKRPSLLVRFALAAIGGAATKLTFPLECE